MSSVREALLQFVNERMESLLRVPSMWGSDESVELQILQLLEVRFVALNPGATERLRDIQEDYVRFVQARFPGEAPEPLSALLRRHERSVELASILRDFVVAQKAKEEDRFPTGVRLRDTAPEQGPRFVEH